MSWTEHPAAPAAGTVLCALAELPEPGAREFRFGAPPQALRLFVVRHGGLLRAYRNLCPHFGLPLNIRPDQFLDAAGERLLCRMHYAQFRVADGVCERGPCVGHGLAPIPVAVREGRVCVAGP
jgi:nitrite reductase/ring-hydroxylating ferredoxin subunit